MAASGAMEEPSNSSTSDSDSLRAYLWDGDNFKKYSSYIAFENAMWLRRREKGKGRYFFTDLVSEEHFDIDETGIVRSVVHGQMSANFSCYFPGSSDEETKPKPQLTPVKPDKESVPAISKVEEISPIFQSKCRGKRHQGNAAGHN